MARVRSSASALGAPRNCAGYAPSFPPRSLLWCALNALSVPNAQSHQVKMDAYGPANVLWWKSWCWLLLSWLLLMWTLETKKKSLLMLINFQ